MASFPMLSSPRNPGRIALWMDSIVKFAAMPCAYIIEKNPPKINHS